MSILFFFVALSCADYDRRCDPSIVACRQCDGWPEERIGVCREKGIYERLQSESPHTALPAGVELGRGFPALMFDHRRF